MIGRVTVEDDPDDGGFGGVMFTAKIEFLRMLQYGLAYDQEILFINLFHGDSSR